VKTLVGTQRRRTNALNPAPRRPQRDQRNSYGENDVTDQLQQSAVQALMHEMGLSEATIERRKKIVGFEPADLGRIAAIRDLVTQHAEDYVTTFFNHLAGLEDARPLLASRAIVDKARQLKRDHLVAMVQGDYGMKYVEQRLELGALYARAGLDTRVFLGAFHQLLRHIGNAVMKAFDRTPFEGFENFMSLKKIAFFDIGIIVDILVFERERVIRQQQEAIRELSTPVLQIRERLLLLPIIGVIDTQRARLITESLLRAIRANRAKVVVMDVTGVVTIDSKVANHLLQTVAAARLMGALVIVTGLSSDVAQSLVTLGIELSKLNTVGDLQGGLEEAERILGYRVSQVDAGVASPLGAE
jgi:rsbT co-antagonist protein RsbR